MFKYLILNALNSDSTIQTLVIEYLQGQHTWKDVTKIKVVKTMKNSICGYLLKQLATNNLMLYMLRSTLSGKNED